MGNEIFALEIENEALRGWVDEKCLYEFKTRIKYSYDNAKKEPAYFRMKRQVLWPPFKFLITHP
jgi:hypothetical protein